MIAIPMAGNRPGRQNSAYGLLRPFLNAIDNLESAILIGAGPGKPGDANASEEGSANQWSG